MTFEELKEAVKGKQIVVLSDLKELIKTGEFRFKVIDSNENMTLSGTYAELINLEKPKLSQSEFVNAFFPELHKKHTEWTPAPTSTISGDIEPISENTAQKVLNERIKSNANLKSSIPTIDKSINNQSNSPIQPEYTIGFTCDICGETQNCNYFTPIYFPVCDNCKSDLKKYVLSVRK